MGRTIYGWLVMVLVALSVTATPADAKDRKSDRSREREPLAEMMTARQARSVSMRQDASATSVARSASSSPSAEMSSSGRNGKPIAPLAEQLPGRSNPFRFNIGAVAVQPAVGGIKGAQFSIGF